MKRSINNEINKALEILGVKGETSLRPLSYPDRIEVTVNGVYFGVWDTIRKTFVD